MTKVFQPPYLALDAGVAASSDSTRPGDHKAQQFALDLGAQWAGDSSVAPPDLLDAAIIFAPFGERGPMSVSR